MAIISKIGGKSLQVRALYLIMYGFLVCGACTMVYPFMLMISGSTKSNVDINYFDAVPRFLHDEVWLYRKHLEGLFNDSVIYEATAYGSDDSSFEKVVPPGMTPPTEAEIKAANDAINADAKAAGRPLKEDLAQTERRLLAEAETKWKPGDGLQPALITEAEAFLDKNRDSMPPYYSTIGYLEAPVTKTIPQYLRGYKNWLRGKYGNDIAKVNEAIDAEFIEWNYVTVRAEQYLMRREKPNNSLFQQSLNQYKATVPDGMHYWFSADGYYKKMFIKSRYGADIEKYNEAHKTDYASYDDVHLARQVPTNEAEAKDWEEFVRNTLALHWVRVDAAATQVYRDFLKAKHVNIQNLNKNYGTTYTSFDDIQLIEEPPLSGMALSDWEAFFTGWTDPDTQKNYIIPVEDFRIHSIETLWQDFLAEKFGTVAEANAKLGTSWKSFAEATFPQRQLHYQYFLNHTGDLKLEFCTRNYRTVAEYMLFHGRGIFNTVVYCVLAVLCALLVNPLAAYAMSRYKMPSSYKILLFMLCTMAFPPMVTSIPNFLMLRQLGLLNTFAALILPGLANGYSIFLLKGFFDAQPQELYESAQLDGANEWVLFWQIAMSLSKPILAVIALQAFTMAYSNFMFAFVVCQDEKMWTLMVWLYQLQQRSGQSVMYASLIIAALPTFLIFLFCQNIIMRGIVVPSEK